MISRSYESCVVGFSIFFCPRSATPNPIIMYNVHCIVNKGSNVIHNIMVYGPFYGLNIG